MRTRTLTPLRTPHPSFVSFNKALNSTTEERVLHVACHGSKSRTGRGTLEFKDSDGVSVEPTQIAASIERYCRLHSSDPEPGRVIDCVILNACNGSAVARELSETFKVAMVIFWDSEVDDTAALCFTEGESEFRWGQSGTVLSVGCRAINRLNCSLRLSSGFYSCCQSRMTTDDDWDTHTLSQFTNAYKSATIEVLARRWSLTCSPQDLDELQAQRVVRAGDR